MFEAGPAGYIDPRRLLDAQLAAARADGAALVREAVVRRERGEGGHLLHTEGGETIEAATVVLATGSYANAYLLPGGTLPLRVKTEVTILVRLSRDALQAFETMPTLIYDVGHPTLADFYLVPPTTYPDGHVYLKAGADTVGDETLATREAQNEWMRAGDSERHHQDFRELLGELMPELPLEKTSMKRCLITYTAHGLPYIDELEPGLIVATGGNGRGAKSSDAIGAAAAELALGRWSDPLARERFRVPSERDELPDAVPL